MENKISTMLNRMERDHIEGNPLLKAISEKNYINKHGLHFWFSVFGGFRIYFNINPKTNSDAIISLSLHNKSHQEFFTSYVINEPEDLDRIDETILWIAYDQGKASLSYDTQEISGAVVDFLLYKGKTLVQNSWSFGGELLDERIDTAARAEEYALAMLKANESEINASWKI